jgi:cytochrome c-type biogenesis protein CcmH
MRRLVLAAALLLAAPAAAVQPNEMLDDPALEERARDISGGLRCLVCRNESIDDSNADFARTLRLLVRERIVEGDSDEEVVDYVVARYGEYVLLSPTFSAGNALIWLAGPILFIGGAILAWRFVRGRAGLEQPAAPAPLTDDEKRRLASMLND